MNVPLLEKTTSQYVPLRAKQATIEHCAIFSGTVTILAGYAKKSHFVPESNFTLHIDNDVNISEILQQYPLT